MNKRNYSHCLACAFTRVGGTEDISHQAERSIRLRPELGAPPGCGNPSRGELLVSPSPSRVPAAPLSSSHCHGASPQALTPAESSSHLISSPTAPRDEPGRAQPNMHQTLLRASPKKQSLPLELPAGSWVPAQGTAPWHCDTASSPSALLRALLLRSTEGRTKNTKHGTYSSLSLLLSSRPAQRHRFLRCTRTPQPGPG